VRADLVEEVVAGGVGGGDGGLGLGEQLVERPG
jgi:hypothetical protein